MQLIHVCTYGLLAFAVSRPPTAAQELLDLVKAERERKPRRPAAVLSAGGCLAAIIGSAPPRLPLEATLLSIAPLHLSAGEDFTYEVALKNNDTKDFRIPWSPHAIEGAGESRRVVQAIISLRDLAGDKYAFGTLGFYGSLEVPGSIRTLKPGERVIIRAGGGFMVPFLDDRRTFMSSLPKEVTVRARLVFVTSECVNPAPTFNPLLFQNPAPVISVNEMSIKVQKPARP